MRFHPIVVLAAGVFAAACDQPQQPDPPTPQDTAGWETVDLAPHAISARAVAINDDGTILLMMIDSGQPQGVPHRPFIYRNGVLRALVSEAGAEAQAMNSKGLIAGRVGSTVIAAWDSSAGVPRQLDTEPGFNPGLWVVGVNDRDDILAEQTEHDGLHGHGWALLWRNGVRYNLGYLAPPDTGLGHPSTYATAVNNRGQIVGRSKVALVIHLSTQPGEVFHPFLWEDGVMRDLGVLAQTPCEDVAAPMECGSGTATDINAHGVVVGSTSGSSGWHRAFVWENGVMRDLGVYPGQTTRALAINDRGQILGVADTMAFLWDNGETHTIIGAVHAFPNALGVNGEVIGSMHVGNNVQHAFIWKAGRLTDLGVGTAVAINSHGDIIGNWYGENGSRAILWRKKR